MTVLMIQVFSLQLNAKIFVFTVIREEEMSGFGL